MPGSKPGALPLGYATILHDKRPPYYGVKAAQGEQINGIEPSAKGTGGEIYGFAGKTHTFALPTSAQSLL